MLGHPSSGVWIPLVATKKRKTIVSYDDVTIRMGSLTPISLGWIASIFTPHALEVGCANRTISLEDTIELLVIVHHNSGSIWVAAQRLSQIEEGTSCTHISCSKARHDCWCKALVDDRDSHLCSINTRRFRYIAWNKITFNISTSMLLAILGYDARVSCNIAVCSGRIVQSWWVVSHNWAAKGDKEDGLWYTC